MKVVRARLCDEAYRTRRFTPAGGTRTAGLDFELLQRIRERRGHIAVALGVHVKRSIQRELHSGVQTTGDRKGKLLKRIAGLGICSRSRRCGSSQSNQL